MNIKTKLLVGLDIFLAAIINYVAGVFFWIFYTLITFFVMLTGGKSALKRYIDIK